VSQIAGVYRAVVADVRDKEGLGRVQVTVADVIPKPVWAPVSTLMAGDHRGTWFVPDVGDEVLVAFQGGDASRPVVLGSLWSAKERPPETMDAAGANAVRVIRTRAGLEIRLDDAAGRVAVSTPDGASITLEHGNVTIKAPGVVEIDASQIKASASIVEVDAGMSKFSGVVQCDTLVANSVVASSYTPGAGNIW
jgi:phage baseplate assembly protein V